MNPTLNVLIFIPLMLIVSSTYHHSCDSGVPLSDCPDSSYCSQYAHDIYFRWDCLYSVSTALLPFVYKLHRQVDWLFPYTLIVIPLAVILIEDGFGLWYFVILHALYVTIVRVVMGRRSGRKVSFIPWIWFIFAFIAIGTGAYLQADDSLGYYYIRHPLWHLCCALACMLALISVDKIQVYTDLSRTVETTQPLISVELSSK